jgi:hypothetical protein
VTLLLNWSPGRTYPFTLAASTKPAALAEGSPVAILATAKPGEKGNVGYSTRRKDPWLTTRVDIAAHNDGTQLGQESQHHKQDIAHWPILLWLRTIIASFFDCAVKCFTLARLSVLPVD